jgi:TonB family protein
MREESWYKMFVAALLLHMILFAAFSIPIKKAARKIDLSSYSVNLVGDIGAGSSGGSRVAAPPSPPPEAKKAAPIPAPPKKTQIKESKTKPILQPKVTEKERSITVSKAKPSQKKTENRPLQASKDEVSSLDEKIQQMRRRTQYMDVGAGRSGTSAKDTSGESGLSGFGAGGSRPLDPVLQKYINDIWERIQEAWRSPGLVKKSLETRVSVRVRKDGRIMDFQIDQRSGDRVFDETVARTLRAMNDLPPFPASLSMPDIEIGFSFHP